MSLRKIIYEKNQFLYTVYFNRCDVCTPVLMEMSTTAEEETAYLPGKYTFTHAIDLGDLYEQGGKIVLMLKHRDSRSAWEPWRDSDYAYTITFNHIITFETLD